MKILITGFEPFGGEKINPAWEAVNSLPSKIDDIDIFKLQFPTVFRASGLKLFEAIDRLKPDVVICVGQAGGRFDFCVERIAINIDDGRIPDNNGHQPIDETIFKDGENAYFSTLPIKAKLKKQESPPLCLTQLAPMSATILCIRFCTTSPKTNSIFEADLSMFRISRSKSSARKILRLWNYPPSLKL